MHPDLAVLIELQQLETAWAAAEAQLQGFPQRRDVLAAEQAAKEQVVESIKQAIAQNVATRRAIDKDLAVVQGRLDKFRDQLMAVKTNKEYTAIQLEIATAQGQVKGFEDQVLALMLEADDQSAALKAADQALADERSRVMAAIAELDRVSGTIKVEQQRLDAERAARMPKLTPAIRTLFEQLVKTKRGVAVAELKSGHCTACHVRLRPQMDMQVRASEQVLQCDSCKRILFHVAVAAPVPTDAPS